MGYRIVGLTATPGNNNENIQRVITNLNISCIEARWESDPETWKYLQYKEIEVVKITRNFQLDLIDTRIKKTMSALLKQIKLAIGKYDSKKKEQQVIPTTIDKVNFRTHKKLLEHYMHGTTARFYKDTIGYDKYGIILWSITNLHYLSQARKVLLNQGEA